MSDWKQVKLNSLIDFYNGFAFKSSVFQAQGIPVLKIKNVKPNRIILNELAYVSPLLAETKERYLARKDDILITMSGNRIDGSPDSWVGKVARFKLDGTYLINQRVSFMRVKETLADASFLGFYLSSWEMQNYFISKANSSGGQANISPDLVKDVDLSLPSLPEQKAIASVLSSLDDKIDLLHRQNKTLEAMAETLFRQWFIEEAKEDWDEVQVKEVATLNRRSVGKNYIHGDILYLDTGSLTKGVVGELQSYSLNEAPSRAKRLVQHNDILISTVRPNQCHYGIVSEPKDNLVVSTGFCTITCETISPYFVYLLLTNTEMTEYLHSIAEGSTSTYPSLKPEDIGAVVFQMPPKELLQQFHNLAESYWQKIHSNHKQIQTLENLRDTLLPKLMSGEVRVQYQTEEVA